MFTEKKKKRTDKQGDAFKILNFSSGLKMSGAVEKLLFAYL
jgi:hypothetical protein